eukprot:EG_transcript_15119
MDAPGKKGWGGGVIGPGICSRPKSSMNPSLHRPLPPPIPWESGPMSPLVPHPAPAQTLPSCQLSAARLLRFARGRDPRRHPFEPPLQGFICLCPLCIVFSLPEGIR